MNKILITLILLIFASSASFAQSKSTDVLKGKTICVFGDSYVANHRRPREEAWHCLLANKYGMTYNNHGRNGSCVAFDRTKDGFGPSMLIRYKEMTPDADYVLIIAGHNDADKCKNNADSLKMFADSMDVLLTRIRARCPKAKIGWVTPWYVGRDGFAQVCSIIKKVCKKHKVPVLYNYSPKCVISVRDDDFRKRYFQGSNDTAHLNAEGHKMFLPIGESWFLKRMLK